MFSKHKSLIIFTLLIILSGIGGFQGGVFTSKVKVDGLMSCFNDPFFNAVGMTESYAGMFTERELRQSLQEAPLPAEERKRYSEALDYVFSGVKHPTMQVLTDCLNK